MRTDLLLLFYAAEGGIDAEWSSGNIDRVGDTPANQDYSLIEAALFANNPWTTQSDFTTGTGLTFTVQLAGVTTFPFTCTAQTPPLSYLDVGKTITATGLAPGTYILSVNTNGLGGTLSQNPVTAGSAVPFTILGRTPAVIYNGTLFRSFVVEQGFTDIGRFIVYRGMAVEEWDLNITARAAIMETITWMGVSGICNTSSLGVTPGPTIQPNALSPVTSGPYVSGFETQPPLTGICVRSWRMKVKNNMRVRTCVESRESGQFGLGAQDITGTMEVYFTNEAIFNDMVNNTFFQVQWSIVDLPAAAGGGGYRYDFLLPKVKIAATRQDITGVDTDIFQTCDWRALYSPTLGPAPGAQIQIGRTAL
jgi:hypothetical protein